MYTVFELVGATFPKVTFALTKDSREWVVVETYTGRICAKGRSELKGALLSFIPDCLEYGLFIGNDPMKSPKIFTTKSKLISFLIWHVESQFLTEKA